MDRRLASTRLAKNRVGVTYLILALVGAACALGLSAHYHLGTASEAVTMLPTIAGLYLSWATFQSGQTKFAARRDLAIIADDLADAVQAQWGEELRLRRLNDPYPLPISWSPVADDLVESWPVITAVARDWPGEGSGDAVNWASTPADLAAQWAEIVDVFSRRIPTRRLVVLGEPGSGKTVLLVRLAQGLLAERVSGSDTAVPVIFPLSSWNPIDQDLFSWMSARLSRDYLGLDQFAPPPFERISRARALIDQNLILPILDGFDELPPAVHSSALDVINQSLSPGRGIVLSSRVEEFRNAMRSPEPIHVKLAGAAGIQLLPIDPETAGSYLVRDGGGDETSKIRWAPVRHQLGTSSPIGLALRTPLMLFLARTIYNPRPSESLNTALPDPAILCDQSAFPEKRDIERHLMERFVPACYRTTRSDRLRWNSATAEHTLKFLARYLEQTMNGAIDLAWWQLTTLLPRSPSARALWIIWLACLGAPTTGLAGLIAGFFYGLIRGIMGDPWSNLSVAVTAGVLGGLIFGATFGMVAGATTGIRRISLWSTRTTSADVTPITSGRWSWNSGSVALSLMAGIIVGATMSAPFGSAVSVSAAVLISITGIIWGGLGADPADVTKGASPDSLLGNERRIVLRNGVSFALLDGIITGILVAIFSGNILHGYTESIVNLAIIGLIGAAILGVITPAERVAWWSFTVTRWYFSLRYGLPRDLMGFLRDGHQRGVLRQVAGVYQFRHLDLQRSLAFMEPTRTT
jgi:NACHT domain